LALRYRWLWPVFFGLSLEVAACGGSLPSASQSSGPIEDCRSAAAIASANASLGPVQYITLVVDGKRRDYRLFQPPGLINSKPIPLVIALHGTPMTSDQWESIAHFDDEAAKAGFIAAYPDGCNEAWQYSDGRSKVTDVDFIRQVIDRLETEFPIDKSRVFMVGVSAGSVMTYRLACDLSKQIAAIASVSGAMRPDTCQPAQPVSVLEMHGTNDCWTGGCPYAELLGVDALIQRWRTIDGCAGDPILSQRGITKTSFWEGCKAGTVVRLDTVVGGLHQWYGSDFNPIPDEPNANEVVWSFFSSLHPRA
jgi:polyhydroxybutyrate depolymerase